jgi:small-conductance mechanosensitive channel
MFERPIKIGGTVQTTDNWGMVTRIGIRASTIRSFSGAEISVPNADLISKEVINWTRSDKVRRIEVPIGVAYGTDPRQVLGILLRVAREHPRTLETPEPDAQMLGYGESSLNFRVRLWTHVEYWVQVSSDINVAIHAALWEAGISIPFPQRDLHVKSIESDAAAALKAPGNETLPEAR